MTTVTLTQTEIPQVMDIGNVIWDSTSILPQSFIFSKASDIIRRFTLPTYLVPTPKAPHTQVAILTSWSLLISSILVPKLRAGLCSCRYIYHYRLVGLSKYDKPQELVPIHPMHKVQDWDTLKGAISWDIIEPCASSMFRPPLHKSRHPVSTNIKTRLDIQHARSILGTWNAIQLQRYRSI